MKGSSMGYLLKTGFKNVYMNRLMSFASIGVLVACLMLIGSAVLLSLNMQVIVGAVEDENEMVAFLNMDVSDEQAKQIGEEIKNIPEIEEYYFYSSEEAWAEEQKKWGAASAMVEVDVDGNDLGPILPDAYRIKLKDVSQATLDSVEQQLLEIDGIDPDIRTPREEATILSGFGTCNLHCGWCHCHHSCSCLGGYYCKYHQNHHLLAPQRDQHYATGWCDQHLHQNAIYH